MILQSIRSNAILLGAFALITAIVLASTEALTRDKIAESERKAAQRKLLEIISIDRHDNDLLMDVQPIPEQFWASLGLKKGGNIHIARKDGQPVAAIIPTLTRDGYSGDIAMLIGINFDGTVAGVRVTKHRETPGLGDKVDLKKTDWILDFNGKSLVNPEQAGWDVKKNGGVYDQFTGATITPRAVVRQIAATLKYFSTDSERLLVEAALANQQVKNETTAP